MIKIDPTQVEVWVTLLGLIGVTLIRPVYNKIREYKALHSKRMIIGIFGCAVPKALMKFPDFTDIRKARMHNGVSILHCKNLSYALKICDFVIADVAYDPKIIAPDDEQMIEAIIQEV